MLPSPQSDQPWITILIDSYAFHSHLTKVKWRKIFTRATFASSMANLIPIQARGPGMDAPPRGAPPRGAKGVPRPASRRKKRLLPRPALPRKIPLLPSPAPPRPWKWSNCGAFAGQNENSKTLKRPKIFTNAYGQAGHFTVSLTIKNPFWFLTTSLSS